jgi:predicted nucleic acid-binding protein
MVLCDTNIFISAFNGRQDAIDQLNEIGLEQIALSAITVMELLQWMGNKNELAQMKKRIKFYDVVQIDSAISVNAIELIESYRLRACLKLYSLLI